jgi:hypothetical protein
MLFLTLNRLVQFKLDPDLNPEPEPDSEPEIHYDSGFGSAEAKSSTKLHFKLLHTGISKTLPTFKVNGTT